MWVFAAGWLLVECVLGFGLVLWPVLWAIGRERRATRVADPECARCGYILKGNLSGRCPECGVGLGRRTMLYPGKDLPLATTPRLWLWATVVVAVVLAMLVVVPEVPRSAWERMGARGEWIEHVPVMAGVVIFVTWVIGHVWLRHRGRVRRWPHIW
jgi:hypothetical protein